MNKIVMSIFLVCSLLFSISNVTGIQIRENYNYEKSGSPGSEIVYEIEVYNDEITFIDVKAEVQSSEWNVEIIPSEYVNVRFDRTVIFTIIIKIPDNIDNESCITYIQIFSRYSMNNLNQYEEFRPVKLITHTEEEELTLVEILIENSVLAVIILSFVAISGYTWYGRQYFFMVPLYSNIQKEKLLNCEKRELIKDYLIEYNGSNLTEIANGTGINVQTLRHHMKLLAKSEIILKKENRYFIKLENRAVFDTECLSPILQKLLDIIRKDEGLSVSELINYTKRSKPWMGKRLHELLVFDLIEIVQVGRYKQIYLKSNSTADKKLIDQISTSQIAG